MKEPERHFKHRPEPSGSYRLLRYGQYPIFADCEQLLPCWQNSNQRL